MFLTTSPSEIILLASFQCKFQTQNSTFPVILSTNKLPPYTITQIESGALNT